jgi:TRAP-type C4-dicarboxylate transport system permease small subunit
LSRLRGIWRHTAEGVAALAFATLFLAFVIQVVSRYLLNAPVAWTLELCAIAYVWVVFWSAGVLVPERRHIAFDVLYHWFPPRARRWIATFLSLSLGLAYLAALPGVLDYIRSLGRRSTMLLHLRLDLVYACFAIFLVAMIAGCAHRLWALAGPRWRDQL